MQPFNSSNPARLDRRITLLAPESSRDVAGGEVKAWLEVGDVWGDWNPQPGREIQQASQFLGLAVGTLRIRWRAGVAATWRVAMGSTVFDLVAPPVEVGRRQYLDLVLRAISGPAPAAVTVRFLHDFTPRKLHDGSLALLHNAA